MVKQTENWTICKYTIINGKIFEKQYVFTVVRTTDFVFTVVKCNRLWKILISKDLNGKSYITRIDCQKNYQW